MQKSKLSGRVPYLGLSIQEVAKLECTPGAPDRGDRPPLPRPWEASQWARLLSHMCLCLHKQPRQGQGGVAGFKSVLHLSGYEIYFCESCFLVSKA